MSIRKFDADGWKEIKNHLAVISAVTEAEIKELMTQLEAMCKPLPKKEDDDSEGEQLCDCTFTLAYGMTLFALIIRYQDFVAQHSAQVEAWCQVWSSRRKRFRKDYSHESYR